MTNKPKLLFLMTKPPLPAVDGARELILGKLEALALTWQVDLFIVTDEKISPETIAALKKISGGHVFNFYVSRLGCRWRVLARLFSTQPLQVSYFYSTRIAREFIKLAPNYQMFYGHTLRTARYLLSLKATRSDISDRIRLDLNDAISLNYQTAVNRARGLWQLIYASEKSRVKNYELALLRDFKYVSLVTERDRDWILKNWQEKYGAGPLPDIKVLRYGIKDSFLDYQYQPRNKNLVFIGNLYYPPNRQGLDIFIKKIWPLVSQQQPESELLIIGRGSRELFSSRSKIRPLGFLSDPYQLIAQQAVFLNPVTFGAGIATKHILAMALGVPVVSTLSGVAGIEGIKDQENVSLIDYDRPKEAAAIISQILNDKERRQIISQKAKALVNALYRKSKNDQNLMGWLPREATRTEN